MIPIISKILDKIKNLEENVIKKSDVNGIPLGNKDNLIISRQDVTSIVSDLNNLTIAGYFYIGDTLPTNAPSNAKWSLLISYPIWGGSFQFQVIIVTSQSLIYFREQSGPQKAWGAWKKIAMS